MCTSAGGKAVTNSSLLPSTWTRGHGLFSCHPCEDMSPPTMLHPCDRPRRSQRSSHHMCGHMTGPEACHLELSLQGERLWICQAKLSLFSRTVMCRLKQVRRFIWHRNKHTQDINMASRQMWLKKSPLVSRFVNIHVRGCLPHIPHRVSGLNFHFPHKPRYV